MGTYKKGILGSFSGKVGTDLTIDYPKVLISKGNLTGAWGPAATSAASKVNVTWQDYSASGTAKPTDKAILLVYNPEKSHYVFTTEGADRSVLAGSMDVPADLAEQEARNLRITVIAFQKI